MAGWVVMVVAGRNAGELRPVGAELEIGRSEGGLRLRDGRVSRRHARLSTDRDLVVLEDLDSKTGTFVNGERIRSLAVLAPGDRIVIGASILEVRRSEEAGDPPGGRGGHLGRNR